MAQCGNYLSYYVIVTSEMEENDDRIIEIYRGLWKIEEAFKVTKSDLEARPVFVSTKEHIEAHFLTCFVALTIARILEMKTSTCSIIMTRYQEISVKK
ncbi:MAG: transposase [Bacteroidaceae bacterium]|nr:transposase [Bacteroidaceae bacterium]